MPALKDISGQTFGRLVALHFVRVGNRIAWKCRCSCGNEHVVLSSNLISGKISSCGCFQKECAAQNRRDALTRPIEGRTDPRSKMTEYKVWRAMVNRTRPGANVKWYSEKGVSLCKEWESFDVFYADMGPRPSPRHSIDRIENNKGYSKENCRWATSTQQIRNRSNTRFATIDGVTLTLAEWAIKAGVSYRILMNKTRSLPAEDAVRFFLSSR